MNEDYTDIHEGKGAEQETRQRIIAAAKQLMAEKGYKGATTRKIAELAGVNEVTVFRHFKNKEGLLDAALLEMTAIRDPLEAFVRDFSGSVEELLAAYARRYYEILVERKDSFIICMFEARDRPELAQLFCRIPEAAIEVLRAELEKLASQGILDDQKDHGVAAHMLLSTVLIEFIVNQHIGLETTCPMDEYQVMQHASNILFTGLRK
ncbi:TetR/AcrR family transcriptional regulator [Brevibacillus fluminis]|uniref:TetR/AcrR family transcriptional regulator n=1 Tax=Brevibacillus fluminis TaxID=511487 RepID=A0A3M8D1M6_9BACL|nr:TetR/AcrR family transcriptional regulator [Brevibacillus fluminis]RNB81986.1 TetR/AcrR family transcriptional regulator [Brevibacillus fluminis]